MASKKQKPQGKATPKPQSDPWLKWRTPMQGADVQRFLANPEEHLGMGILDYLDFVETLHRSEILSSAQRAIYDATKGINLPKLENIMVPNVLDVEDEDGTSLSNIPIFKNIITNKLSLIEIVDKVFSKLEMLKAAWPHQDAIERARNAAQEFVRFLFAVYKLGQEKITQAKALGRMETAAKLEKAYKDFCMIELTGDIDTDAKRLFLERKITPDEFHAAMRRTFVLDRQATKEINQSKEEETFQPEPKQKKKLRRYYPHDPEALETLREAERRSKSDKYQNLSRKEILQSMISEDTKNRTYRNRILKGKKKNGAWEYSYERAEEKEVRNWERYFSAYLYRDTKDG